MKHSSSYKEDDDDERKDDDDHKRKRPRRNRWGDKEENNKLDHKIDKEFSSRFFCEVSRVTTSSNERGTHGELDHDRRLKAGTESKRKEERVDEETVEEVEHANFGLSGTLNKDERTGNVIKGVESKYAEPSDAKLPNEHWRLFVFKGDDNIDTLHIHRKRFFLFGRDRDIVDIPTDHPSCSKQHAVIQFRNVSDKPSSKENPLISKPKKSKTLYY